MKKFAKFLQKSISPIILTDPLFLYKQKEVTHLPTIYIIGLPRSGTTLLYQLITTHFRTIFITNLASVFYRSSILFTLLFKSKISNFKIKNFDSDYGTTTGILSPSEFGSLYRYYFKSHSKPVKFFRLLNILKYKTNLPLILKNLNLIHHIPDINSSDPNALYIYIERDLRFVTQSIFIKNKQKKSIGFRELQKEDFKTYNIENLGKKIKQLNEQFKSQLIQYPNSLIIDYNELCENPIKIMEKIAEKTNLEKKLTKSEIPEFQRNEKIRIEPNEWQIIDNLFNK